MEQFLFPFGRIGQEDRIVLYGAGNVGKAFLQQLKAAGYSKVVLWVDRNYKACQERGMEVSAPSEIVHESYDYVVIAVQSKEAMREIRAGLLEMGIGEEKIIWSDNYLLTTRADFIHNSAREEYEDIKDSAKLKKISATELVSYSRLDVLIRYLLCRDIINEVENEDNLKLYFRCILSVCGAREPMDNRGVRYFSDYESVCGLKERLQLFRALIDSMRKNGFQKCSYISVDADKKIINGAHRTAAALALEEEVWTKRYDCLKGFYHDYKWFEEIELFEDDKLRVMRAYADLYPNCGIIILFADCERDWELLEKKIAEKVRVVCTASLEFGNNLYGFYNILQELFCTDRMDPDICRLAMDMISFRLHFKVLLVSDEECEEHDIYRFLGDFMQRRNEWYSEVECRSAVYVYATRDRENFLRLKEILLSVNNVFHAKLRLQCSVGEDFNRKLEKLDKFLAKRGIEKDTICIAGKAVMELFGLGTAEYIDILTDTERFDEKSEAELAAEGFILRRQRYENHDFPPCIKIQTLVHDNNFYFMYRGFKFANLELVRTYMEYHKYDPEMKKNCRVLQLFFDYKESFPDTKELKERFQKEIQRQESWMTGL